MDKEYIVKTAEDKGEAQFGARRYQISFVSGENVSAFSKYPVKEGDTLFGHIEQKGSYFNWKFGKREERKDVGPAANNPGTAEIKNILMLKVIPLLEAIYKQNPPIQKETRYDVEKADDISDSVPF